eukprot:855927-Pleurochrysis_carterae.AAC.1
MVNDVSAEHAVLEVRARGGEVCVLDEADMPCFVLVDGLGGEKGEGIGKQCDFIRMSKELNGEGGRRGDQGVGIGGAEWAREVAAAYKAIQRQLQKPWRGQSWRAHTGDQWASDARSTEFGWSNFPGGSEKQKGARRLGKAYK